MTALAAALFLTLAADPQDDILGGGCAVRYAGGECRLAVEPSVALSLVAVDLKDRHFIPGTGSLPQGGCYGFTYAPRRWYASGASGCLSVVRGSVGSGASRDGTTVTGTLSLSLLRHASLGLASLCRDGESGIYCHAVLLLGLTVRAR